VLRRRLAADLAPLERLPVKELPRSVSAGVAAARKQRARAPTARACAWGSPLASFRARRQPHRPTSITIPRTACRAAADSAADRADTRANRCTAPGVSADCPEQRSSGRTPGSSVQRPRRHRLARRRPVTWRRVILRILRSRCDRHCRKHPSRCATGNHKSKHFRTARLAQNPAMLRRSFGRGNGRPAVPLPLRASSC
jgi:hypothetical protein